MPGNKTRQRWTYAEFAKLPESWGTRYEVIAGELVVTPSPKVRHQKIVTDLLTTIHAFVRERGLGMILPGPVDVLFAEGDYLAPDLVFVHESRADIVSDRGIEGPPDLVVEVLSPGTAGRDRGVKLDRYRHYGVGEYWIVDADANTVEVWHLASGAASAELLGADGTLRWAPDNEATLEIQLSEIFGG